MLYERKHIHKSRLSGYKKASSSVRGALRGPGRVMKGNISAKERKQNVMKFNIYFDDGVILPTEDMKTAFKACDMPDRVAAVTAVNYNGTEEVLWGEKPRKNNASECWSYPHPVEIYGCPMKEMGFKSLYVLKVEMLNKETDRFETLYYELDEIGFENAMKDVQSLYSNKHTNWTKTQQILRAMFFSHHNNGQFYLQDRFEFNFK